MKKKIKQIVVKILRLRKKKKQKKTTIIFMGDW